MPIFQVKPMFSNMFGETVEVASDDSRAALKQCDAGIAVFSQP
jgi:hypothetical protein